MPTERIQRQIDRLLDEAEQAVATRDWALAAELCRQVLTLDEGNADALPLLALAERGLSAATESMIPATASEPFAPAPLPTSFANGRFEVKALLGEGGRKTVYRAHDTRLDRDVAFALIKTEGLDAAERERVQREARTLGRLSGHPNVVTVYEIGEEPGGPSAGDQGRASQAAQPQPFLVSELLGGGDLAGAIAGAADHRLPLERVLSLGKAIAEGLAFAHSKGVVHRDLKPGNVWLTAAGEAKIGDFGLATAASDARITQAGKMVGTALYLAPEQAMGQEVTPRSDLYSLGCVLYELVTGRPPFVGDENVAIIGQHLNANPVAPTWHRPDCPKQLEAFILRLLEKDPGKRPASAADVAAALQAISAAPARTPSQPAPAAVPPSGTANPVYRRIFVGREVELKQLEGAFDAAVSGQGGLVMVVGEPGIGKTTLTEQLTTYAALRGGRTLVGHCYEEGSLSLPYLPFVEAMRSYVLAREPEKLRSELGSAAPDVARIVSEVRDRVQVSPSAASADPGEDRYRLLNAVSSFLHNAAAVQPLVIVLEDLHDADRGTLDLLTFVARQLAGARLLVVGTYRDVEVDRAHPLSGTVAELRRGGRLDRIALRGLTADEVQRMLSAVVGQDVPRPLAEAVFKQTEGNPLFVQEVVRYLAEEGLIVREGGRWSTGGSAPLLETIPEGLRDVIGKRLSRLGPECNQLLSVASVIGRDFHLQTLVAVAGETSQTPADRVPDLLDEALKVAVLQEQARPGGVQYRFAHAFFRQTLYDELSAARRIRLHQQVARALESQYAGRLEEHAAELAEHFTHSSTPADLQKAVHYGQLAAQRASSVYAHSEAARLLRQAIDVQEVLDPADRDTLCTLLLALADTMLIAGELRALVDDVAPRALRLAESLDDTGRACRACLFAVHALFRYGGGWQAGGDEFLVWAERLDAVAPADTVYRVWADGSLAQALRARGHNSEAWERRAHALALARQLGDSGALSYAVATLIYLDGRPKERQARLAVAKEFAYLTEDICDEGTRSLLHFLFNLFLCEGDREAAEEQLARLERYVERSGDRGRQLQAKMDRAKLQVIDGHLEEALNNLATIVGMGDESGSPVLATLLGRASSISPLISLGRAQEAQADLARPILVAGMGEGRTDTALRSLAHAHLGHRAEVQAQWSTVRTFFGDKLHEMGDGLLGTWIATADVAGDEMHGRLIAEELTTHGDYGTTIVWTTLTCVARHLGGIALLGGDRAEAMRRYAQALDVATRMRHRPETALTRLQIAELLADGTPEEQAEASAHLAFVVPEFEAMKMQPALERARALSPSPPLRGEGDPAVPGTDSIVGEDPTGSAPLLPAADRPAAAQASLTKPSESSTAGSPSPSEAARGGDGERAAPVFVSYAGDDRPRAVALADALEAAGQSVWIDRRSIAGGASWDEAIVHGLRSCRATVVLCSAAAMASRNVQQELRLAMQYKKPILPVWLETVVYPPAVEYILAGRQYVELLDRQQPDWLPGVLAAIERLA